MQYSTLLIEITNIWRTCVEYRTVIDERSHKHFHPVDSQFPFTELSPNRAYVLLSVRMEDSSQWHWLHAIRINFQDPNIQVLEDAPLAEFIEKEK